MQVRHEVEGLEQDIETGKPLPGGRFNVIARVMMSFPRL